MSGRRNSYRYEFANGEGTLRVLRDVTVQRGGGGEFVAISGERAALGEHLMLERVINGTVLAVEVEVVDSRPIVVGGTMRHRIRLKPVHDSRMQNELAVEASTRSR